jgi:hypothetical protein
VQELQMPNSLAPAQSLILRALNHSRAVIGLKGRASSNILIEVSILPPSQPNLIFY